MKNKQLLSTLIYVYIIILTFVVLYYIYNQNIDLFYTTENTYNTVVNDNISKIQTYISDNQGTVDRNKDINKANKIKINELMEKSVSKLSSVIDNYILNI